MQTIDGHVNYALNFIVVDKEANNLKTG